MWWWNFNAMPRMTVVIAAAVLLTLSMCSSTTSSSSSIEMSTTTTTSAPSTTLTTTPATVQQRPSLAAADKRCDQQPEAAAAAADHHQSNDLARLRETMPSAVAFAEESLSGGADATNEQQRRRVNEDVISRGGRGTVAEAAEAVVAARRHVPPSPDDGDNNDAASVDIADDSDGVRVEDDDDDNDADYADGMQNDQPAAYRGNSQQHYYGNVRRQPPSSQNGGGGGPGAQPPPLMHDQQQQHQHIEYTREIQIKQGRLRGMVRPMHPQTGLRNVRQFLGIPYAAAPVGSGRFMPPGAPPPWHGAKVFTVLSPVCPQQLPQINGSQGGGHQPMVAAGRYDQLKRLLPFLRHENEDCLFLNLYAPETKTAATTADPLGGAGGDASGQRMPVVVFVHGESYEWNSGNAYDGSVLASYGQVVVVTLNYRLGILGFLKPSISDHTVSNFGLLDQIAALQWVKDNIAAFGGNNQAVTLMGHGTGAACVNLLMLSPVARGLFHRAILMSGSALSDWAIANHPLPTTMQVVQGINCPLRDDNEEILQCLRKKRYQDIMQQRVSTPAYGTVFGPVVDNLVVPNQPYNIMGQYNEMFSRYDMLFGMTEIESYHNLNAVGLAHGLLESERDSYLRSYMQNRYEIRPDIALALTLQEYTDTYNNPERPLAVEHRDTVLEILSDARIAAPMLQTGLFHSKVNPRSYMYVFGHNSRAGEYANLPLSIVGEDLPYVFGAPLAATSPFPTKYSAEERLLSESIMLAWTNFAKTGNPRAPSRGRFLNLEPADWERYDLDWPEFNAASMNYLNIGIPPVVNQKYRHKYMQFWNQALPDELNRTLTMKAPTPQYPPPHLHQSQPAHHSITSFGATSIHPAASGGGAHINYFPDRSTEDPFRTLKLLLNRPNLNDNAADMYNTQQSTVVTATIIDNGILPADDVRPPAHNILMADHHQLGNGRDHIVGRADATLGILITVIVSFILLNAIAVAAYLVRRYYTGKRLRHKLDVLTLDGATTEADHDQSGCAVGGMRAKQKHSNDYETVTTGVGAGHSPIVGGGYLLNSDLSTSTVDAHTKVSDWMCQEIRNGDNNQQQQQRNRKSDAPPSFALKTRGFFRRNTKAPQQHDVTIPAAMILESGDSAEDAYRRPMQQSYDTIICQDVDVDAALIDGSIDLRDTSRRRSSIPSLLGGSHHADSLKIDHRHSRSDPVQMYYRRAPAPDEDITFFIDDPAMSSARPPSVAREPLSADEALNSIRMRNYPKVLPRVPDDSTEYVTSALCKRRSLPPQYFATATAAAALARMPPAPPQRTTSTLGRAAKRDSSLMHTSPLRLAAEPPVPDAPPDVTCNNVLHVGPLLPRSTESIYSTVTRTPRSPARRAAAAAGVTQFTFDKCVHIEAEPVTEATPMEEEAPQQMEVAEEPVPVHRTNRPQQPPPKVAMRPQLLRQLSAESHHQHRMSVQSIAEEEDVVDGCMTMPPAPLVTGKVISSRIPQMKAARRSLGDRSTSDSSTASSSSGAETVKQVF